MRRRPFGGMTEPQILFTILEGTRPSFLSPTGRTFACSRLEELCLQCWSSSPSHRPSMSCVLGDLVALIKDHLIRLGVSERNEEVQPSSALAAPPPTSGPDAKSASPGFLFFRESSPSRAPSVPDAANVSSSCEGQGDHLPPMSSSGVQSTIADGGEGPWSNRPSPEEIAKNLDTLIFLDNDPASVVVKAKAKRWKSARHATGEAKKMDDDDDAPISAQYVPTPNPSSGSESKSSLKPRRVFNIFWHMYSLKLISCIAIFRWVCGELISKGVNGRVYSALNANTGEMLAVRQLEIPKTEDKKDGRQHVNMVEALKLESETLKDLDHPNIVQYMGFEQGPDFLSM